MDIGDLRNVLYKKSNITLAKSYEFAKKILGLYQILIAGGELILSKQLLRSGTSIGANLMESQYAASRKDFLNKLTIALKEANETFYWLQLLKDTYFVDVNFDEYLSSISEIIALLVKSIKTSKDNQKKT